MFTGVINVYKEKGFTSHDVVAKLRGILKQKKIGHTGTLDPDAVGVLPICLGRGTKLCDMLTEKDKTYEAVLLLGRVTDTQDTTGVTLEEKEVVVSKEEIEKVIYSFQGEYDQVPPMYSALKVNGKKLYELAREGKEVERKPRKITILKLEILEWELPRVKIRVSCSKGTYIRTLCHDIGTILGCGGCMDSLVRTKSGFFSMEESHTLKEIEELMRQEEIESILLPVDQMFKTYPQVVVKQQYNKQLYNGNPFEIDNCLIASDQTVKEGDRVRVYDEEKRFIGVYELLVGGELFKPVKLFFEAFE